MFLAVQVVTVFLVAISMSMSLAHALEFPGKMRLDEQTYKSVQTIYYPGFTFGGIGEALAVAATLILVLLMPGHGTAFWCVLSAFIAILTMHTLFWFVTQPTNRYWLRNQPLGKAGMRIFATDRVERSNSTEHPDWKYFRDRWEYSHIARALLSGIALVALLIAIVI